MVHFFDAELAAVFGIEKAVLIQNFAFWISKNAANKNAFYDGRYWTFHSSSALLELLPEFRNAKRIEYLIKSLTEDGILLKGNYNKTKMDRTCWYAFTDLGLSILKRYNIVSECISQKWEMDSSKVRNGFPESGEAIHDITKDNNNPPLYSPLTGGISPQGEIFPQGEIEEVEVVRKPIKKKAKPTSMEFDLSTVREDFREIVSVWLEYKRKRKETYKSQMSFTAMCQKLNRFSGGNAEIAKQIIEEAIGNNYAGFFPLKGNSAAQSKKSLVDSMRETERIYQERKRMKENNGW